MEASGENRQGCPSIRGKGSGGEAEELHTCDWENLIDTKRTPLFAAEHSARYERQNIINNYQECTGANLIVVIDQIYPANMTVLEELLGDCTPGKDLHVILSSPGGDGETALRMVRAMHEAAKDKQLTIIVPDMAKSAATILCLGADHILMGPTGDLGPIDPQMMMGRGLVSAKAIVAAVDESEQRVKNNQAAFPLFTSLLSDVNMFMVEQARFALERSESLMQEALASLPSRSESDVNALIKTLKDPLIDAPASHAAVFSAEDAIRCGLPVKTANPQSDEWKLIWMLWTRYFTMGSFPKGNKAIYEGARVSHEG